MRWQKLVVVNLPNPTGHPASTMWTCHKSVAWYLVWNLKLKWQLCFAFSELGRGGEDGQSGGWRIYIVYWINIIDAADIKLRLRKGRADNHYDSKVYVTDIAGMHDFYVLRVKDMPAFRRWYLIHHPKVSWWISILGLTRYWTLNIWIRFWRMRFWIVMMKWARLKICQRWDILAHMRERQWML